jgi:hypothetical protein
MIMKLKSRGQGPGGCRASGKKIMKEKVKKHVIYNQTIEPYIFDRLHLVVYIIIYPML